MSAGSTKAAVLPEPVSESPTRSFPARAGGIPRAWIGEGFSKSSASTASRRGAGRPSLLKGGMSIAEGPARGLAGAGEWLGIPQIQDTSHAQQTKKQDRITPTVIWTG